MYGILGDHYWWNVPAIDEVTGEIVYDVVMTTNGSHRAPKPTDFCKQGFTIENRSELCSKRMDYQSIGKGCDDCYWFIEGDKK